MILTHSFIPFEKDLHGWNGNSPIFLEMVADTHPQNIIEIGSWKGQSTVSMAKAARKKGLQTKIFCVDTWLGALEFRENERILGKTWDRMLVNGYPNVYYQFLSNMIHEGVLEMIEPVPSPSRDAVPFVPEAELIYIDGNHYYEAVKEDLELYWPKLKQGGIMFGDDYFLNTGDRRATDGYKAGVRLAVDEFAQARNLKVETKYDNFWIIKK